MFAFNKKLLKMKKSPLLILALIISSILIAQEAPKLSNTIPAVYLPHGYVLESISGTGFQNCVNNHIANINSSNPASSSYFKKLSLGLSYQFDSSIQPGWIADISRKREQNKYPQSIGLIVPVNMFRFGFGFSQRYNSVLDYGQIERITLEQPDRTGEYFTASKTDIVYCYSGLLSYSIDNFLSERNILSIGLEYCYNYLEIKNRLYTIKMSEDAKDYSWTFGAQYNIKDKIHIGLFYLSSPFFEDHFLFDGTELKIEEKIPDKFSIGISYNLNSYFNFSVDFAKVYWRQHSDNLSNYLDISGGVISNVTKQLSLSLSVLSTGYHSDSYFEDLNRNLYSLFLLGGLNLRFQHFDIDLAYVTSTKYSGDWRKQKIGKISLGFYL